MNLFQRLFVGESEHHCVAMEGLISESNKMLAEDMEPEVADAAIIAATQKIEHYEISSYGTARTFAMQLGLNKVAALLEETLNEEYEADDLLTELAISKINLEAIGEEVKGLKKIPGKKGAAKKSSGSSGSGKTTAKKTGKRTVAKKSRKKSSR